MNDTSRDPDWFAIFEKAIDTSEPTNSLRKSIVILRNDGFTPEELQVKLELFRKKLLTENREDDDDVVLDVLDFLVGWCSPGQEIE